MPPTAAAQEQGVVMKTVKIMCTSFLFLHFRIDMAQAIPESLLRQNDAYIKTSFTLDLHNNILLIDYFLLLLGTFAFITVDHREDADRKREERDPRLELNL